jgi:hypothetical protein
MHYPKLDIPTYTLELPSTGDKIKYRPFTVKERKILLIALEGKDDGEILNATKQVIHNCIIDYDTSKFTPFDIEYIFLQLRSKSIGQVIKLNYICRNKVDGKSCDNSIEVDFDIDKIKIIRPEGHSKKIPLRDNLGIVMKYPSYENKNFYNSDEGITERVYDVYADCVDYVYDSDKLYYAKDTSKEETVEFLESLRTDDFEKIENFFETTPYIEDKIDIECSKCGYKETNTVEGLTSFFI